MRGCQTFADGEEAIHFALRGRRGLGALPSGAWPLLLFLCPGRGILSKLVVIIQDVKLQRVIILQSQQRTQANMHGDAVSAGPVYQRLGRLRGCWDPQICSTFNRETAACQMTRSLPRINL